MLRCDTIAVLRQGVCEARAARPRGVVGLVPTMGALHAGHRSLIDAARRDCDLVVVSIFLNPAQFGPGEDFDNYPRALDRDQEHCRQAGVDIVFIPTVEEVYAPDAMTTLHVRELSEGLCGRHRPGHFDGVALVVCKLLNMVGPDRAYFGRKDAQQLVVVRRMVADLNIPVDIVDCPTVREPDGLAMSSRNVRLNADQRRRATSLYAGLCAVQAAVNQGQRAPAALRAEARACLDQAGVTDIDYIELVDPKTLQAVRRVDHSVLALVAARIGSCRLIDNLRIEATPLEA